MKSIIMGQSYTVVDAQARVAVTQPGNIEEWARRVYAAGGRDVIVVVDGNVEGPKDGWMRFAGKPDDCPGLDLILTSAYALEDARCPLLCLWPEDTSAALNRWYYLVGCHWFLTPGVAGLEVLRTLLRKDHAKWADLTAELPAAVRQPDIYEPVWTPGTWSRPGTGPYVTIDRRRAGLAAAGIAELAGFNLEYSNQRTDFTGRAGWVQIERGPWNDERMPDPIGPRVDEPLAWVTTARLALLRQLESHGFYKIGRVWDSYTGPARRVLRTWSETINGAYMSTWSPDDPTAEDLAVREAAKAVGRETVGMFDSKGGACTRSDWFHTITAVKACNTWRKAWQVGQAYGIWPIYLDDDTIAYDAKTPDGRDLDQVMPYRLFPEGEYLGKFRWQRHDAP